MKENASINNKPPNAIKSRSKLRKMKRTPKSASKNRRKLARFIPIKSNRIKPNLKRAKPLNRKTRYKNKN